MQVLRREKRRKKKTLSIDTHLTQTPSSSAHSSHSNWKQSGQAATAMKIRETHRVVFMGSGGVGKTSLITQFMEGMFIPTYKPTVEDYHRHNIKTPGKKVNSLLSLLKVFLPLQMDASTRSKL